MPCTAAPPSSATPSCAWIRPYSSGVPSASTSKTATSRRDAASSDRSIASSTRGRSLAEKGSYEAAGVSIERGGQATGLMRSAVEGTHGPEVLGPAGGFAGLYALSGYEDPVLSSTIDGVGTKVLVAREVGRYDALGADIVNHCANDVLATGAHPLIFLDYIGS